VAAGKKDELDGLIKQNDGFFKMEKVLSELARGLIYAVVQEKRVRVPAGIKDSETERRQLKSIR
jgi:hypothetical protein